MSKFTDHIRAGASSYGAFLVLALGLWIARDHLPMDGSGYLLPIGPDVVRSAISVALCMLIAVLASLGPDIDIKSQGQMLFYRGFLVVDLGLLVLFYTHDDLRFLEGAAFLGLLALLPLIGKHRGWTHSRFAMLLLPSPLLLVPMAVHEQVLWVGLPYYLAGLVGYGSHLYKDGMLLRW